MTARIRTNSKKGLIYAILFVALLLHGWMSQASASSYEQSLPEASTVNYSNR